MKKHIVFSSQGQVGKTTDVLSDMKVSPDRDNILITHDQDKTLEDALKKADKLGVKIDGSFKDKFYIKDLVSTRLKGEFEPKNLIGLGNIATFNTLDNIVGYSKPFGLKQTLIVDEIHKFAVEDCAGDTKVKRDSWLRRFIANESVDQLIGVTATAHDLLLNKEITFDGCTIVKPYGGFHGIPEMEWKIRTQEYFDDIREAFKAGKPPPLAFINDIRQTPNMMVNISALNAFHSWVEEYVPEFRAYNQKRKEKASLHLVGGHAFSMSNTFDSNYMMLNRASPMHAAALMQAAARVHGPLIGTLICTQKDKDRILNYYENMEKISKESILLLPAEKRVKEVGKLSWTDPANVCSPKTKKVRQIKSTKTHKEGRKEDLVENRYPVWVEEQKDRDAGPWRHDGGLPKPDSGANLALTAFKQQHPNVTLPEGFHKAIQDPDEQFKFRTGNRIADVRVGQTAQNGWCYVIIRTGKYEGSYSFYNEEGDILSSEVQNKGQVLALT